jgi:hypothetical protein
MDGQSVSESAETIGVMPPNKWFQRTVLALRARPAAEPRR